ncbi:hypothetical protein Rfer_4475 (plasmid) [Rhodoferax ferrireducens T118]|uniref:Uncharacterized protein n=2 Tax=Rhodoferax ferrireducens TaxID=192843 RepID=Q21PY4_ALBFT|nr:hypothetical protein Rfer_4475 [Rhodoferax ferrireducens T118]
MGTAMTPSSQKHALSPPTTGVDATSTDAILVEPTFELLADLPRGHDLRVTTLRELAAECRNKLSKEWRKIALWCIATSCYDDLSSSWTDTNEFRVQRNVGLTSRLDAAPVAPLPLTQSGMQDQSPSPVAVLPAVGVLKGFTYRIEMRTWYVNGRYLGQASEFSLCDTAYLVELTTGHFYGDWNGTRFRDGAQSLARNLESAVELHDALRRNAGRPPDLPMTHHPIRLDNWGEYRITTAQI